MLIPSLATARAAASLPLFAATPAPDKNLPRTGSDVAALFHATTTIAGWLAQNRTIDAKALREVMATAFGRARGVERVRASG